ncbi:Asp-tRNA(Asn)/Glu-tRNA(Gln) amidotransferase subunit GatA [Candidatus Acetothermia bacterium]|nr:Asp-tRNA(Asn)/Glu-tRNA(Gln) amidotransferase subunit GatA [Candidatus Acetothermia bacterium]MBI3643433.1 Asp-tRNA(Asn)/Glu-tRNA(Gln) amidotransferase subunit GatA [Candidatus Acetothermia bacterium]
MGLNEKPMHELIRLLSVKEITIREIIRDLYRAIEERETDVRAYLELSDPDALLKEAERAKDLPLKGIPIAVKDLISTTGFRNTCGSQFLRDFRPTFDATAILKLKAAGATILGKTNLDEFGMGSSTENSGFFPTQNPFDLERVPGGSSGGSAAAVAAASAICALGTDTGGSIRLPAAFCGVVGVKPTYGLVSRYGLVAYASSLDQIGPLTRDVRDAALLLSIVAGHDPADSTSAAQGNVDYTQGLEAELKGIRIGIVKEFVETLSGKASALSKKWQEQFQQLGARFEEISLPHSKYAIPTYYLISAAEASANLARYDGVRFGHRESDESVLTMYALSRDAGFGVEVKRRIMLGTYGLSAGYADEWYKKAQGVRALITQDFQRAFQSVDVIMTPTSPTPAFKLGEKIDDPLAMYLTDQFLVPASLAQLCAISIPAGQIDHLPFGLQLIGDRFQELNLLHAAFAFEQAWS